VNKIHQGFTLIELVTVLILMSALAAYALPRITDTGQQQVQAGRDYVVAALFSAQQLAMVRSNNIRLITSATQVDIRLDANVNGTFEASESLQLAGIQYPLSLPFGVTLAAATFDYDRLGRTSAASLAIVKGSASATITVSDSGYAN